MSSTVGYPPHVEVVFYVYPAARLLIRDSILTSSRLVPSLCIQKSACFRPNS